MTSNWFRFEKASPEHVDIYIVSEIGDWMDDYWGYGVTARAFIAELMALPDTVQNIRVLINSPGGDVYSGLTIANALRMQHAEKGRAVETHVMGIAASAASLILMGGTVRTAVDNAVVMIHDPWTFTVGDVKDHKAAIDRLGTLRDSAISTYKWHASMSKTELSDMMADEAYLSAAEAKEHGFLTDVISGKASLKKQFPAKTVADLKLPSRFEELAQALTAPRRSFQIAKSNVLKKQCFGWASVAVTVAGVDVVDAHQHVIPPDELEAAAYKFVQLYRDMDEEHTTPVSGTLIESMVITPDKLEAMGLPANALPQGWWVGFQVTDDAVFQKVMKGELTMFSIAGTGVLEDIEE